MNCLRLSDFEMAFVDRGHGRPLLLVHGFPLSHTMWDAQVEAFARDYRVIVPDLRGFGQSALPDTSATEEELPPPLTMQQLADDLAALLSALEISEPITFCGLSMGGYVGWQFWQRHASRLRALIQCDTRAGGDTPEARANRHRMAEGVLRWGSEPVAQAMMPKLFAPRMFQESADLVARVRQSITDTPVRTISAAQLGMAARPDMTAALPQIDVPALLLCGEHDALSPPSEMCRIAEAMPQAEYLEVPDAGHMAPLEQPEIVNDAMRRFLSTQT